MAKTIHRPVGISLYIKEKSQVIEEHSVASPYIVGEELARQVAAYVQDQHLGYYPAIDYFRDNNLVDEDLLNTLETISWLLCDLIKNEVRIGLRSFFANLAVESIQPIANTIPAIRPGTRNAMRELALHYTPDQVRLGLRATSIRNIETLADKKLELAKKQTIDWLKQHYATFDVADIWYLDE